MAVAVGIDIAKEFHWVAIAIAETGKVLVSQRVNNHPDSIDTLINQLRQAEADHGGSPPRQRRRIGSSTPLAQTAPDGRCAGNP